MYCANCGKEMTGTDRRCPGCRHFSLTFWLTLFNLVAWLAIVAMTYAVFICLFPLLATVCASLLMDLPPLIRLNFSWSNFLSTFGILIGIVMLILGPRLIRSFGRFPRLGKAVTVFSSSVLVLVAAIMAADGRYLKSFGADIMESFERTNVIEADSQALDATRSVVIAGYRYRELHPKAGFTCDLASLEPLGGPARTTQLPGMPNLDKTTAGAHALSLQACQGMPVTKYQVSAVPDPSFGDWYKNADAYCSDGSGALYSAEDGKSETCLTARKPVH